MSGVSPSKVLERFIEAETQKSAPKKVEPYFKKVKEQNPDYSDSKAWATAWSIYCEYKNPGDKSCRQDEYFPGRSKKASPNYDRKRMSVLFVSSKVIEPVLRHEAEREKITIQNLEPYEEADIPLRVLGSGSHPPQHGQLIETKLDLEYPVGSGDSPADIASLVRQALGNLGKKLGAKVEPCAASYHPRPR